MTDKPERIVSPKGRAVFEQLAKPKSFNGGPEKYSVTLIFDKAAQGTPEFKRMVQAYTEEKTRMFPKGAPANFRSPFRAGSEKSEKYPESFPDDSIFVNVSSQMKPDCIDARGNPIMDNTSLYSGMYGRASLNLYSYDQLGNKGLSFGLNNFQKLAEGPVVSTRPSAADDFGVVQSEDSQVDLDAILNA